MMCSTLSSARLLALHTLLAALRQIFLTLPIIWAQVLAKVFLPNPREWPFRILQNVQRLNTRALLIDNSVNLDPPWFSLYSTITLSRTLEAFNCNWKILALLASKWRILALSKNFKIL
jgi:hypothetical protein